MENWATGMVLTAVGGLVLAVLLEIRRSRREDRQWRELARRLARDLAQEF